MLISIDGIDGCGKSTQVGLLTDALQATRIQEISPTRWGKTLRAMESPSLAQQLALFTADRACLAETLEAAAGSETNHIVSDRSFLCGVAYQSHESPLTPHFLRELNRTLVPEYDLQILLDVPLDTAFARIESRGEKKTWCETPGLLSHARMVFHEQANSHENVVLIDATQGIGDVFAAVRAAVEKASVRRFDRIVF